jgi:hypothetical protein
MRPIAVYVVLNFLWNRIRAEMKKRILVIDEAWNLMQYEDSARFLYGIVKRARKYFLGVTTITQDVDDFVESPYGKPVITNSSLQFLLKQSPATVDGLQKLFYLTDGEKYHLLNSDVGQGIVFAGYKHVAVEIIASPEEAAVITTKPEEVLAQKAALSAAAALEEKKIAPTPAAAAPAQADLPAPAANPAPNTADVPAPLARTVPSIADVLGSDAHRTAAEAGSKEASPVDAQESDSSPSTPQ